MDFSRFKKDFPALSRKVHGKRLAYLDSAASSQQPLSVTRAIADYSSFHHANVHRGVHTLSAEATELFEGARKKVASFINASPEEIVFTRNATESLNLVAHSWGDENVHRGEGVLLTQLEHHSNIVPWQMLVRRKKAKLHYACMAENYLLDEEDFSEKLEIHSNKIKIASFTAASNALGSLLPVKKLVRLSHSEGSLACVDACQLAPHQPLDVKSLGCDFAAFSSHKMLGPTGIGVLYARRELLEEMPPFLGGGDMIKRVSWKSFETNDLPYKFEAGTPNIAGAVGLGAAVDYLQKVGLRNIQQHCEKLLRQALEELGVVPKLSLYGSSPFKRSPIVSFNLRGIHAHDAASILDFQGVAVRSGHHCAMPLMGLLGVPATCRASFYLYNDEADITALVVGLRKVRKVFS